MDSYPKNFPLHQACYTVASTCWGRIPELPSESRMRSQALALLRQVAKSWTKYIQNCMYQIIARQWRIKSTHKVKLHQIAMWKSKLTCAPVIISQNQCPPVAVEAGASKAWFSWVASWKRHWLRDSLILWTVHIHLFVRRLSPYRWQVFGETKHGCNCHKCQCLLNKCCKGMNTSQIPPTHAFSLRCIKYLSQITKATPLRGTPWSWLEDFDIANVAISQRSSVWIGSSGVALGYCTGSSGRWRCSKHSTLWSLWLARLGLTGLSSKSGERCDSSRALALR